MNEAFVFVENYSLRPLLRRALLTKKQGYMNFLIYRPFEASEQEMLTKFEKENLETQKLFDVILENTEWDLENLRHLTSELDQLATLKAFITLIGHFSKDGLLGAHVATLAVERGLPSQNSDALYRTNNKYLMRDALRANGVSTVDFGLATDEELLKAHASRIGYPVILKPVTGIASHLILKCNNEKELIERFRLAMKKLPLSSNRENYSFPHDYPTQSGKILHFDPMRSMLVERYITGREASVEVVITETEVIPLLVHDKVIVSESERVFYEHLLVVPPVRFTETEIQEMKNYAKVAVQATGLKNSLCHVELRYDDQFGPQVLEINPRVGGMLVFESLKTMVNFDVLQAQIDLAQGTFKPAESYRCKSELHAMFTLYPPHSGLFEGIEGEAELNNLEGIIYSMLVYPVGTHINGDDEEVFLLMVWMRGESYEQIIDTYKKACQLVKFRVKREADTPEEVNFI